jgi:hypothetical protein
MCLKLQSCHPDACYRMCSGLQRPDSGHCSLQRLMLTLRPCPCLGWRHNSTRMAQGSALYVNDKTKSRLDSFWGNSARGDVSSRSRHVIDFTLQALAAIESPYTCADCKNGAVRLNTMRREKYLLCARVSLHKPHVCHNTSQGRQRSKWSTNWSAWYEDLGRNTSTYSPHAVSLGKKISRYLLNGRLGVHPEMVCTRWLKGKSISILGILPLLSSP